MNRNSIFALLLVASCEDASGPSRADVLRELSTDVIVPTYGAFETRTDTLEGEVAGLCEALDASALERAQAAWRDARVPLKQAEAWAFGPIEDLRIEAAVDFWPVRTYAVDETLESGGPFTLEAVEALGVASRGLPALEYLLFDHEGGSEAVLERLGTDVGGGTRACAYAAGLALDVEARAAELHAAWSPAGEDYASAFSQGAGEGDMAGVQMSLDTLVNRTIFALANVTDAKLGKPLGRGNGGSPVPGAVESRFSDNSWADIRANIEGVGQVYFGKQDDGTGLQDLIVGPNPDLDTRIVAAFGALRSALAAPPDVLRIAVVEHPEAVNAIRDEVLELRRLFQVDLATQLGVTVTLNDNDGD